MNLPKVRSADVEKLAGMISASTNGNARNLEDFDAASMLTKSLVENEARDSTFNHASRERPIAI